MAGKALEKHVDETEDDSLQAQIAVLQEQVQALVKLQTSGGGGLTEDRLEKILMKVSEASAQAMERAANPSNKTHPGISVYSYPEGDRASAAAGRPRRFKCPMFWAGYDMGLDTTTAEEIELFNLAEPGVYKFLRTDRTWDVLTVTGERDAGDALTKLHFTFLTDDKLDTLPGITVMLQTAFHVKTAQERELDAMRKELEAMRAQIAVTA